MERQQVASTYKNQKRLSWKRLQVFKTASLTYKKKKDWEDTYERGQSKTD